jgi:hypothetical protein
MGYLFLEYGYDLLGIWAMHLVWKIDYVYD